MRIIVLTFRESEFLWWAADQGIHPTKMASIFREVMRDKLGQTYNAKVIVKFADKFDISDTAMEEWDIENCLNDVFFWMEETQGWLMPTGPLVG